MNTLTPNRILQKGDQYLNRAKNTEAGAKWMDVPKEEIGLQIMFSKLKEFEIRRPTEKPFEPISPDSEKPEAAKPSAIVTAKAENGKDPAPIRSGAGLPLVEHDKEKCPCKECVRYRTMVAGKHPALPTTKPRIRLPKRLRSPAPYIFPYANIRFDSKGTSPQWTGRNGTFNGYGLEVIRVGDNISIFPVGKRGSGNCEIQIPLADIPKLKDALNKVT